MAKKTKRPKPKGKPMGVTGKPRGVTGKITGNGGEKKKKR